MTERKAEYKTETPGKSATITLPWPARELSPNARLHYHAKAKFISDAKHAAYMATTADNPRVLLQPPLFWHIEIYPPDFKRRDADNLIASLKAAFDGIFAALGVDDKLRFVSSGSWHVAETKPGGLVVITIGEDH